MARSIELPDRIEGRLVSLRPMRAEDVPAYAAAFGADPALGAAMGRDQDPSEAELAERPGLAAEAAADGRWVELAIAAADDRLIGTQTLHSIDWRHEHAEVGFWLEPGARGRGAATEATVLIVDWAFVALGLHRIEMVTLPEFEQVLALADRLGFRSEGVMRERNLERGRRLDTVMLSVLREEWERRA